MRAVVYNGRSDIEIADVPTPEAGNGSVARAGIDAYQRTGQVVERLAQALLIPTADKAEGTSACLEARPSTVRGR